MKRPHISGICTHALTWMVVVWMTPTLHAEPAEGIARQLQDTLEQQGWAKEQAADGSMFYYPAEKIPTRQDPAERLRQALERWGWRIEKGPDGSLIYRLPMVEVPADRTPVDAETDTEPQSATEAAEMTPGLVEQPGPADSSETPTAIPTADNEESVMDTQTPGRGSGAASQPPVQERRLQIPRWSRYHGYPRYRPWAPSHYPPPPGAYRRSVPPCPRGPWACGWRTGKRPGYPVTGMSEQDRESSLRDELSGKRHRR